MLLMFPCKKCSNKPNLGYNLEMSAIITVYICSYPLF